jgi:hypothetical protein
MASGSGGIDAAAMSKRILAGGLWFLAASYAWGFVSEMTGILPAAALPIGILVAAFVIADPLGGLWSLSRQPSRVRPVADPSAPKSSLTPGVKA